MVQLVYKYIGRLHKIYLPSIPRSVKNVRLPKQLRVTSDKREYPVYSKFLGNSHREISEHAPRVDRYLTHPVLPNSSFERFWEDPVHKGARACAPLKFWIFKENILSSMQLGPLIIDRHSNFVLVPPLTKPCPLGSSAWSGLVHFSQRSTIYSDLFLVLSSMWDTRTQRILLRRL